MMKLFGFNEKLATLSLVILSYYSTAAQAKLVVSGAKINMANAVFLSTKDISLSSGSTVTVAASTIKIAGTMSSSGSLDLTNGTVETNGTAAQIIPANVFAGNVVRNMTVRNTAGVTMQGDVALTDVLSLSDGSLASNGYLTLKSTFPRTARVAPVTSLASVPVSGDVIVERYIPAKRAYRLLTAPVNSSTSIKANWMENTNNPFSWVNNNPAPGFGTHITGTGGNAAGFDVTGTLNPSMYTLDPSTQLYVPIANTSGTFASGNGYKIFIRGSRSTDLNDNLAAPSVTTLRAKGSLVTGTVIMAKPGGGGTAGMPQLSNVLYGYSLAGNPYASVLNWNAVEKNSISTTMYIFDPTISGSNGRGAFVSYNGTFDTVSNSASHLDNNIQSGQAFFVQTIGSNPTITFRETHKASANRNVFRRTLFPMISVQLLLPSQVNTADAADGCMVFFSEDFSSDIRYEDSYKFINQDENLAILRNGKTVSIEGRQPASASDSIPLKVWQLTKTDYSLKVKVSNFNPYIQPFLHDAYLNTTTPIGGESVTPFKIDADTASAATDRFTIIFKSGNTLPAELSAVKAYEKDKGIQVEWLAQSEINIDRYIVEKSANGQQFVAADSVKAKQNTSLSSNYAWFDAKPFSGSNYYRIKSVDKSGAVKYSSIVKVNLSAPLNAIVVTNNPVRGQLIQVSIKNLKKGDYTFALFNAAGQLVHNGTLNYTGGVANEVIKLNRILSAGIYKLHFAGPDEEQNVSVLFE